MKENTPDALKCNAAFTLIFQLLHITMSQKVRLEGQVSADT